MAKSGNGNAKRRKIRYAVVGMGYFAQAAALPAFSNAKKNSELVAIISGDREKLKKLGRKYKVEHTATYEEFEDCLERAKVDAVYIALPNHLHREYTLRAARSGAHVLCEKPMAVTEAEGEEMIRACEQNEVKLMIAYRLHLEKANLSAMEIVRSGKLGEPRLFNSVFSQQVVEDNIRVRRETGGGTLYDIGIYCINAARYLFESEPYEVFAMTAEKEEERFAEVEEMASVVMRFPGDRLASFTCSFGAAKVSTYQVVGTKGDLRLDPAYAYADDMKMTVTINGRSRERVFPQRDQVAPELLYFSDCIINHQDPEPSGEEGLIDLQIINALYRSAEIKQPVRFEIKEQDDYPEPSQEISRPAVDKPLLLKAASPGGKK